jgi:OOP family OmpA-OmpF porin
MRLTLVGKIVAFLLVVGAIVGGFRLFGGATLLAKLAPGGKTATSTVPDVGDLPQGGPLPVSSATVKPVQMPGSDPGCTDKPEVRMLGYAWNAHMGLHFANGGAQATEGSLMCRHGVNFKYTRQDDNGKLQEALTTFATDLSQGQDNPTRGAHFVTIMGDGAAAFITPLNATLRRIGTEYQAKVVGCLGFSRGEDKFMGPAEWLANPAASKGGLVAGVLRDGDWNIALKWLGDNNLKNNPDEKTWDPDALNWVAASDYMDAPQKYVAGYSEDRPVVRNGKRTGEIKRVTVNGVVTWTPGDVLVAENKGGLVSIASTREYSTQMPCVVIGIDKWCRQNRKLVQNMLQAAYEGGDAIRSNPDALRRAGEISAQIYKEKDAEYWVKYYKGVRQPDKTGQQVDLGGSMANNLADALYTFGLIPGSQNLFGATYRVFGDVVTAQYPNLVPSYQPLDQIFDSSYVAALKGKVTTGEIRQATSATPSKGRIRTPLSRKRVRIRFNTGQATFTPGAQQQLQAMLRDLLVAGGTLIEIHGHTDNVGDSAANRTLSERRAFAVKRWLESKARATFPEGRIRVFAHGDMNPIVPNESEAGRAQNRRVEIVLGTGVASR